jgi:hypothetical protein
MSSVPGMGCGAFTSASELDEPYWPSPPEPHPQPGLELPSETQHAVWEGGTGHGHPGAQLGPGLGAGPEPVLDLEPQPGPRPEPEQPGTEQPRPEPQPDGSVRLPVRLPDPATQAMLEEGQLLLHRRRKQEILRLVPLHLGLLVRAEPDCGWTEAAISLYRHVLPSLGRAHIESIVRAKRTETVVFVRSAQTACAEALDELASEQDEHSRGVDSSGSSTSSFSDSDAEADCSSSGGGGGDEVQFVAAHPGLVSTPSTSAINPWTWAWQLPSIEHPSTALHQLRLDIRRRQLGCAV